MNPQTREVTLTSVVEDPDTPDDELTFSGGVAGCDGEIDASVATVRCEGASNHVGAVTVTDPQGGEGDQGFTIIVCEDGSVES